MIARRGVRAPASGPVGGWRLEKRLQPARWAGLMVPVGSVALALVFGSVWLALSGHSPLRVYGLMFEGAFGSAYGLSETVVKAIPLSLAGLGVAVAFRLQFWNIGAEGQLHLGALAATWVALRFPELPGVALVPAMLLAGFAAGAAWGVLPALPRAYLGTNEVITTLMLNYVAILWMDYLVYGPWKDPSSFNFPLTPPLPPHAELATLGATRVHAGVWLALAAAGLVALLLWRTRWGFQIRVIGDSPAAARYSGMHIAANIVAVMALSGGLAGLAGMAEVAGVTHRLQHGFSPGFGYTAIIIAWLARLNPWAVLWVSVLFGGLLVGGYAIQTSGLPAATTAMLQGAILFFVLGGEVLVRYRLVRVRGAAGGASPAGGVVA